MRLLEQLLRPSIARLQPYSSARDEFTGEAHIYLDANENPYPTDFNRYPDPHQRALKAALAAYRGVAPEQIFVGNGSDEAIDLLLRAFCRPGKDRIVICPPTYGMYQVAAGIQDAEVLRVPLDADFQPQVAELLAQGADERNKLLFLCSPNNPTGNLTDPARVAALLGGFPGLVILDEAYIDFAPEASWLPRLEEFPNLVVMQTFSKAWGLAGLRLGTAYASPEIIAALTKIKAPYNLNRHTQAYGLAALGRVGEMEKRRTELLQEREKLRSALNALSIVTHIYPSAANFLLVKFRTPLTIFEALLAEGTIIRNRTRQVADCLRITVGTPEENARLLRQLHRLVEQIQSTTP
ncbi:MAG: histidinol-phosphate transaminase [Bacteroidota bacterium]